MLCPAVLLFAAPVSAQDTTTSRIVPNALLSIDQNRSTVIDGIVNTWGGALEGSNAGISQDQLRSTLAHLRSDYLLAASIAGSLEGLRNVLASSLAGTAPAMTKGAPKNLGDTTDDLVYNPVVPCRIVDTVAVGGPITGLGTRDFIGTTATNFSAQGGSGSN
jgi:hypothetical protein